MPDEIVRRRQGRVGGQMKLVPAGQRPHGFEEFQTRRGRRCNRHPIDRCCGFELHDPSGQVPLRSRG